VFLRLQYTPNCRIHQIFFLKTTLINSISKIIYIADNQLIIIFKNFDFTFDAIADGLIAHINLGKILLTQNS